VTNVLSVGATSSLELLGLSRGAVTGVSTGPYAAKASSLGLGVSAAAIVGLHF
jgi:hypothetical protein